MLCVDLSLLSLLSHFYSYSEFRYAECPNTVSHVVTTMLSVVMQNVLILTHFYVEYHYGEYRCADLHVLIVMLSAVMTNDIVLIVTVYTAMLTIVILNDDNYISLLCRVSLCRKSLGCVSRHPSKVCLF
jgi:hypothetical protein